MTIYDNLYIVGNFCGWDPQKASQFSKVNGIFEITVTLNVNDVFVFLTERNWNTVFGSNFFSTNYEFKDLIRGGNVNICPITGTYTIRVNLNEIKNDTNKQIKKQQTIDGIYINKLIIGQKIKIMPKSSSGLTYLLYNSTNNNVASINSFGEITAKSEGKFNIQIYQPGDENFEPVNYFLPYYIYVFKN